MGTLVIQARLEVEGLGPLEVVAGQVRESVSDRCHARVEVASTVDLSFDEVVGATAKLDIGGDAQRRWTLRLHQLRFLGDHEGSLRYQLELHDLAARHAHTRNTRKYRNLSAEQIVSQVLGECGIAHRWQISRSTAVRKYTAQYHESNLAFVERLLAFEGIYYSFDELGVMVLEDTSVAAPKVRDQAYTLTEAAAAMGHGDRAIHHLRKVSKVCSGAVVLADYNWKKPAVLLRQSALAPKSADLELYEYPAGYRKPEQGIEMAQRRLEAEQVRSELVEGRGTEVDFAPALAFAFELETTPMFSGEYFLIDVTHSFRNGDVPDKSELAPEGSAYENHFAAMPYAKVYRPLPLERPTVRGSHTAMVRGPAGEEIHTDEHGRCRVQAHWDREAVGTDEDSRWVRKVQECSTSVALARVGWEMFNSYVDGDPDRPVTLGRGINGVMKPEYGQPANKNRMTIKTPSSPATGGYNELSMEDSAAGQQIYMRAEKDLNNLVKHNRTEQVGSNETKTVGTDYARQVNGNQTSSVGGNSTSTAGSNNETLVEGSRTKSVGGSETVGVGGGSAWAIAGIDLEIVGGLRLTMAGSLSVPDFGSLLKSAARNMASIINPDAVGLYDQATGAYSKAQGLMNTAESWSSDPSGMAQSWLEGKATSMGEKAGKAGWDAMGGLGGWGDWGNGGFTKGWNAFKGSLEGDINGMGDQLGGLQDKLTGMIPSQADFQDTLGSLQNSFDNLVPSADTLTDALESGASTLTGGLSDSLMDGDYALALDQAIDMFCSGGITRTSTTVILKIVGGCYVTAAVKQIDWLVGTGYTEIVGGAKFSLSLAKMVTTVGTAHTVTVGGMATRKSTGAMSIEAKGKSSINVSGAATFAGKPIEITAEEITIDGSASLTFDGGGVAIAMEPGSVTLTGDVGLLGKAFVHFDGDMEITP